MALASSSGCSLIFPDITQQPVIHNPFPQLSKVAVAPFFNQSDEPTVDGREFALAYWAELQDVPGFEVVPLGVTEEAILRNKIDLSHPSEARRLAKALGVDVVVIGSITDYNPYYPPRCGLRVEWYAANPGFHEIPAGYGLPWGTPDEEYIPAPLVFESEMALARAQLATQTPQCDALAEGESSGLVPIPESSAPQLKSPLPSQQGAQPRALPSGDSEEAMPAPNGASDDAEAENKAVPSTYDEELPPGGDLDPVPALPSASAINGTTGAIVAGGALPPGWPDERGFVPTPPSPVRPPCVPNDGPIMTHTRVYHGNDSEFTEALASYFSTRDDARFGGWQTYLQRSNDFIRFCCHMHISELLSARGGAGETRVVYTWPESR